jgi:hypothetical protein
VWKGFRYREKFAKIVVVMGTPCLPLEPVGPDLGLTSLYVTPHHVSPSIIIAGASKCPKTPMS